MSRFAISNFHDQSAAVWIVTLLLLSYTTLTSLVRGYVKSGVLGLDDCLAGAAQLLAYGNIFSVIHALLHGLAIERDQIAGFDRDLKYGKVSDMSSELIARNTRLTHTDTASQYHTLYTCICCSKNVRGLLFEADLPPSVSQYSDAGLQLRNSCNGSLGNWICGCSVGKL